MAEPKDDPDVAHFTQKVANHLGHSRLEENLNDFFELYHEELRGELYPRSGIEGGGQSLRMHELYQKFLGVVKANLEEFLQAEGLTEAELRDACEKETELEDPQGLNIMQTLTSSWGISSFVALASDFVEEEGGPEDYDHHNYTTLETEEASTTCVDSSLSLETAAIIMADKWSAIGDQLDSPVCHGGCCYRSGKAGRCLVKAGDATEDSSRKGSRKYNAGLEFVDHHALQCDRVVAVGTPLESWVLQDESLSTEAQEKI